MSGRETDSDGREQARVKGAGQGEGHEGQGGRKASRGSADSSRHRDTTKAHLEGNPLLLYYPREHVCGRACAHVRSRTSFFASTQTMARTIQTLAVVMLGSNAPKQETDSDDSERERQAGAAPLNVPFVSKLAVCVQDTSDPDSDIDPDSDSDTDSDTDSDID